MNTRARFPAAQIVCWLAIVLTPCGWAQPAFAQCSPVEVQKLTASDAAAFDQLGFSTAIDGNTVVAGALGDDNAGGADAGAAYVFVRNCAVWTQQQKLTASDGALSDQFGSAVAISGNTVVVGARLDDTPAGADAGSVYVFVRSGTVWSQQAKLTASDAVATDRFGGAVAIDLDTIAVGVSLADAGGVDAGAVYVFTRSGTVWTQQAKITPADPLGGSFFGISVAVDGNSLIVGRHGDSTGSAYVFTRSGTVWSQQQKLNASDAASGDQFGINVALNANSALVGSHKDDNAGGSDAGSAYVFTRSGTVWTQQAKLTASDAALQDNFGQSVDLDGDMAVVGALLDDHVGGTSDGSAYVFTRSGTVWTQRAKLTASDAAPDDTFGRVALSAGTVISGAYVESNPGGTSAGSAYVYVLNCDSDGDGVFDENDVCPNTQAGAPVDTTGRPLRDCNLDCVFNAADIQCIVNEFLSL
ncbi:MAG: FG-GAP repeat protein [Planctomycetes bacterium]|nr:FG-GAP repeat protein [Planctomycetota bacterium]